MQMNTDPEWLKKMAALEDGRIISVGGLVYDIEQAALFAPDDEAGADPWEARDPVHVCDCCYQPVCICGSDTTVQEVYSAGYTGI